MKKETLTYIAGLPSDRRALYTVGETKDIEKTKKELEEDEESNDEILFFGPSFSKIDLHKLFYLNRMGIGKQSLLFLEPEEIQTARSLIEGTITPKELKSIKETITKLEEEHEMHDLEDPKRKYSKAKIKKPEEAKRCDVYVFSFGKWYDTKITDMHSDEQYRWCKWFLKSSQDKMKKQKKKASEKTMAHKAVEWWIKKGYNKHLKKGKFKKPTPAQYVFDFGKHEGKKITELTSDKDLGYCSWMYNDMVKNKKGRGTQKLKALRWWLRKHGLA